MADNPFDFDEVPSGMAYNFPTEYVIRKRLSDLLIPTSEYSLLSDRARALRLELIDELAHTLPGTRTPEEAAGAWIAATMGHENELNHYFRRVWKALGCNNDMMNAIDRAYDDPDEREYERSIPRSAGQIVRWVLWPTVGGIPWAHIGIYTLMAISLAGGMLRQVMPVEIAQYLTDGAAVVAFHFLALAIIGTAILSLVIGVSDAILAIIALADDAIPAVFSAGAMSVRILRENKLNRSRFTGKIAILAIGVLALLLIASVPFLMVLSTAPLLVIVWAPLLIVLVIYLVYLGLMALIKANVLERKNKALAV